MKNNITELVFIIDKSGSMSGFEDDTIGGFNSMIEEQKKIEGKVLVSTVLFSNESRSVHDRIDIGEIPPMTRQNYVVGGCTALIDAIGGAICYIETIHKHARPEDVPEKTIFVITTDGMENASCKYTSDEVKKRIKEKESECGWEFLFLAANIDAVETAFFLGIRPERAAKYVQTPKGTRRMYDAMNSAMRCMRTGKEVGDDWRKVLNDDEDEETKIKGVRNKRRMIFGSRK